MNPDLLPLRRAQFRWNVGGPVLVLDQRDCEEGIFRGCRLSRSAGACCADWARGATLNDLILLGWQMIHRDRVPVEQVHAEFTLIREYAERPECADVLTA